MKNTSRLIVRVWGWQKLAQNGLGYQTFGARFTTKSSSFNGVFDQSIIQCFDRRSQHARPSRYLSHCFDHFRRSRAVTVAAIALTRWRTSSQRPTMHSAPCFTGDRWRSARCFPPRLRSTFPASAQRLGLAILPLHGVDVRFHCCPLPR